MFRIAEPDAKKRRLQYDRANLQRALEATRSGMSAYRASKLYNVPPTTLRDRISGRVDADAKVGHETILTHQEEQKLYDHITYMANIGFGYSKTSVQYMAKDFADILGKKVKAEKALSNNWFYGFTKRWPELKTVKPQKLSIVRAKSASRETLESYFNELDSVLTSNNIKDKPHKIYNIDETGVNSEHSPPKIVCRKDTTPQNITSARSSTVTVIASGSAAGQSIPPYYVFPGQRWNDEFLKGACPGSAGEMSKTGWSNSMVFLNYLTQHFLKDVVTDAEQPTLRLYDGHRSHISLTLTEWAKQHNIILFVLPPHSSHLTQPLDVGIFGPFKKMYSQECQKYMKSSPGINITKYDIAELTSKPYLKAVSPENLISAFKKTGIYPFCSTVISDLQVAPSTIFCNSDDETSTQIETQEPQLLTPAVNFFSKRTLTKAVKPQKRKFVPPFKISGNLMLEKNNEILTSMEKNKTSEQISTETKKLEKKQSTAEPRPGTSGLGRVGGPLNLQSEDTESESDDVADDDKCCVCNRWEPADLDKYPFISIVSWGKCDKCSHWTHLRFCSKVRVVRRDSEFICPHCVPN